MSDANTKTLSGDRFLLHLDNESGLLMFACDELLQVLFRSKFVLADGTFKITPRLYNDLKGQSFNIHVIVGSTLITCVWCLLPGQYPGVPICATSEV